MIKSVEEYLDQLRQAMAGADRATIQDALADAEEHLTSALAASAETDSDQSESERLSLIIDEYGSPKEIAAAYRIIERQTRPELAVPSQFYQRSLASRFVSVIYDPRAWGALLYLLTSLLTGIVYFTWVMTGLYLSIGLLLVIIGLPVAWLVFLSFRGIALIEGRIVESLLGVLMPCRPTFSHHNLRWLDQLKLMVVDKRTWTTIAYMVLQMPLGILYFSVTITLFFLAVHFVAIPITQFVFDQPLMHLESNRVYVSNSMIPLVMLAGIFLFVVLMHTARGLGRLHGKLAKAMLVGKDSGR